MDVWFCKGRNHGREALMRAGGLGGSILRAPRKRASAEVCFLLTIDYMEVRKGSLIGHSRRLNSRSSLRRQGGSIPKMVVGVGSCGN